MTRILSKPALPFDITAMSFRGAAADLGEALAFLAGGIKPEPETLARLCQSLRSLQGFLLAEALEQAGREALADDALTVDHAVRAILYEGRSRPAPFQPAAAVADAHLTRVHG